MALQAPVVSLVSVTEEQERLYGISLRLVVDDDEAGWDGIDQTFSSSFPAGGSVANKVLEFTTEMQVAVDRYKNAKAVAKSSAIVTAISAIQSGLVV